MHIEPLYTLRFFYPDGWETILTGKKGTEEDHFYFAGGECTGRISGKFRGSNHPHRRTDETFVMNMQGFIETNDSALIMLDIQGYGRSRERSDELYKERGVVDEKVKFRRQVVGTVKHVTGSDQYRWLNDAACALVGEVRAPPFTTGREIKQSDVKLVFSVGEIAWEPPPE
jgi:hypothetical protein